MAINGIDNLIDPEEKISYKYTTYSVLESICSAYAKTISDRKKQGDDYTGFSRNDYKKYRSDDSPSIKVLMMFFDSWDDVVRLLPIHERSSRRRTNDDSKEKFITILKDISSLTGKSISEITIKDFNNYKKDNKDILTWKAYMKNVHPELKWKKGVMKIEEEIC